MVPFTHDYENCYVITKSSGRRAWLLVAKWKAFVIGRNRPREFRGRKALKHPMFIVGMERKHLQAALCSTGYGAFSGKESEKAAVHERSRDTPKEWFRDAIWKLSRRWQR
jgi:hypothetical protein